MNPVTDTVLVVVAAVEGGLLVLTTLLWLRQRRRATSLERQLNEGRDRRWLPSGRAAVKAVMDTAALVREKGVGGALRGSIEELAGWAEVERPDLARLAARDGTVTILFSDIEGSTALNEELGDRAWLKILSRHDKIVRRSVEEHGGHIVKAQGDGFMIAFASPQEAVGCAVDIQRALTDAGLRAAATPIRVRIGIHQGQAVHKDGDFLGRNVALAARVADRADGGEILVTEDVRSAVADEDLALTDGREVELRGLPGRHHLYAVTWQS